MSTYFFLWRALLAFLFACLSFVVQAQPSGGPYGPIDQHYDIPKSGRVFYVAPNGNAQLSGDKLEAPSTLAAAISRVQTGDTVVLRGGLYRTGNLELNQGVTLQPYADEKPVLKGTQVAKDWEPAGKGVWRTSWKTLFPSEPMYWWQRAREEARTPLHRFNNDMVFIDGSFLQSAGSPQELSPDTYFIDYKKGHVYIGADPSGHTVEITAHDLAILRSTQEVHGKTNDKIGPKIRGISFSQYAWAAIAIDGKRHFTHLDEPVDEPVGIADAKSYGKEVVGTLLENVSISYCSRVAGYFRGDGLIIRNSLISDTGTEGIYVIGSSDVLLEKNVILRNDIERISGYYVSAVKIINQTHNVVVKDNLVMDHPTSQGVWYDVGNHKGVFINNYVEGVDVGFFLEISNSATVAGNVFVNNKLGSLILNSSNGHIYNNTYVDSPARFRRDQRSAQGDHFDWHPATGPGIKERHGHIFKNNLLVSSKAKPGPLLIVDQPSMFCKSLKKSMFDTVDGNVYVREEADFPSQKEPLIDWVDAASSSCSVSFASLDDFRKQLNTYEKQGRQLAGDPRSVFKAPDIGRYELRRSLGTKGASAMPEHVRELLGWSKQQAANTVGAFPAE